MHALALVVVVATGLVAEDPPKDPSSASKESSAPVIDDVMRAEIDKIVEERLKAKLAEAKDQALDDKIDAKVAEKVAAASQPTVPPVTFQWKADLFTKLLLRNNASGGCVSYGNPAPQGDNFSGDNGICSVLGLDLVGRVSDRVEVGARLESRYGQEWADWYENGNLAAKPDDSGSSLGQDHAAYIQLRGIYLRMAPPVPTVKDVTIGATDFGMFNAWTLGKARFIDRNNGRGAYIEGTFGDPLGYTFGVFSLPKEFAGPGYTTGIADPLIENPFIQRDVVYGLKLTSAWDWFTLESNTDFTVDEEADLDDPDAVGSTNAIDAKDGAVVTNLRYTNADTTLQLKSNKLDWLGITILGGYSYSKTNDKLVFNAVSGAQGFSPVPQGEHNGYAVTARFEFFDPLSVGIDEQLEYFNIGQDWVSVMGARREQDVLLTDGFVEGGQLPTLNIANEFQDFTDAFYESCIGWHGGTAVTTWRPGALELSEEETFLTYNTNTGASALDTAKTYPDFLVTDGMTDTDLYTFANTNDRGRDPRSVYHSHQNRKTVISMLKGAYTLGVWKGITFRVKSKYIWDDDLRDLTLKDDDYQGNLFFNRVSIESPITDEFSAAIGYENDAWFEKHRSGAVVAGVANYPDYTTFKNRVFSDLRYAFGGANLWLHLEYLNKDLDASDNRLDQRGLQILRAIGTVGASF